MSEEKPSRFKAMRTRLALVAIGLFLGFAARWIGYLASEPVNESHFLPMDQVQEKIQSVAGDPANEEDSAEDGPDGDDPLN